MQTHLGGHGTRKFDMSLLHLNEQALGRVDGTQTKCGVDDVSMERNQIDACIARLEVIRYPFLMNLLRKRSTRGGSAA